MPARASRQPVRSRPTLADLTTSVADAGLPHDLAGRALTVNADQFAWLPSASVDLVLTDPPFNIARDTTFHTYAKNTVNSYRFDRDKGWDSYGSDDFLALLGSWAREFHRVLRPGGSFAVFCADAYVSHLIDALKAAGLKPRRTLTWRKPNAVPINRATMMMSACEYVVVGVKGTRATFNADLDLADFGASPDSPELDSPESADLDDPAEGGDAGEVAGGCVGLGEIEAVLAADKAAAVVEKAVRSAVVAVTAAGQVRPGAVQAAVEAAVRAAAGEAGSRVGAMYVTDPAGSTSLRGCVPNHVSFPSKGGRRLHPTEKPVPLLRYLTALLSNPGDLVLDPFGGSGSTGEAAAALGREVVVIERDAEFYPRLRDRLANAADGQGAVGGG